MTDNQIKAIPYQHEDLDTWRYNFTGVTTLHQPTNLHIFGAVDDIWINEDDELIVVDYKATAKAKPVTALGAEGTWHDMYRRQMEVYQWLLRQNGFKVSDTGYFVYATGRMDLEGFFNKVEFETYIFPHNGSDGWVEQTILDMKQCMESDEMPAIGTAAMGGPCEYCTYARQRTELTLNAITKQRQNRVQ